MSAYQLSCPSVLEAVAALSVIVALPAIVSSLCFGFFCFDKRDMNEKTMACPTNPVQNFLNFFTTFRPTTHLIFNERGVFIQSDHKLSSKLLYDAPLRSYGHF